MNEAIDESILDQDVEPVEEVIQEKPVDESMQGFMSKEDYVAKGGNADDWRSPREFRERGELIKRTKAAEQRVEAIERRTENEIKNLNMLHEIRLKSELEQLLRQRDDAIDVADKAEVKRIDRLIEANEDQTAIVQPQVQQQSQKAQEIQEWEADNPWCMNLDDPRTPLAQRIFSEELAKGSSTTKALIAVEKMLAAKFSKPDVNRDQHVESSRTAGKIQSSSKITWSQLTPQEERYYIPSQWASKEDFLKAVVNIRKGDK
jgi:hypothetical protein